MDIFEGKMSLESEKFFAPYLIQGFAFLQPATKKMILSRLGELRLQKPTQGMSKNEIAVFFTSIANEVLREGYNYYSIDEGIRRLWRNEDNEFFPGIKTLIKYIDPIFSKPKARIMQLEEIFERKMKIKQQAK